MPLARWGKRAYQAFGQGQRSLGMSDLLLSLIERNGMQWTIVATLAQVLGCKQIAMKFGWDFPSARIMLTESSDHC
jgi:hypothetical protein